MPGNERVPFTEKRQYLIVLGCSEKEQAKERKRESGTGFKEADNK